MSTPELLYHGQTQAERVELGEGSVWDERVQSLYWIDILGKRLHRYTPDPTPNQSINQSINQSDNQSINQSINQSVDQSINQSINQGQHQCWALPSKPGCVVPTSDPSKLLLACEDGCYFFDLHSKQVSHTNWSDVESQLDENRSNDGKCDPNGRLVYGTMCMDESENGREKGSLYSVDSLGTHTVLLTHLSISNGLGWSTDGKRFWHTDTPTGVIREWAYDVKTGLIDKKTERIAVKVNGNPDGFTVDADDHLVVAQWGNNKVSVFDPVTGKEVRSVLLPSASRVSSCAFGGADLTDLYITTAAPGDGFDYNKEEENAGSLFVIRGFGKGRPSEKFAL